MASCRAPYLVAVDHADVGEVELLEDQPRRPVGLERLLEDRAEPLDAVADAGRQLRETGLDLLAGLVKARVEAHPVEVPRERADVRSDRHTVVVEDDYDRHAEAAGVLERLEGDSAGQRAVSDHGDDLAVGATALTHGLLEADGVGDRRRGVARAHDVVDGLGDRAEGGEPAVRADGVELVAATGEDLVRVGLVADVPQHLVARRVDQRVDRRGDLAGAEVGPEVPADLADRVDDQLADLPGDDRELLDRESVQVLRLVYLVEQGHRRRVRM
jgi:hypothetical protein